VISAVRPLAAVIVAVLVAIVAGCAPGPATDDEAAREDAATAHDEDHAEVKLDAEAVARAGIRTATVEAAQGTPVVDATGRVLDPLPFLQDLHAAAAARATATLARAEYERVARLHRDDQNASTRDLQNARAALDKATLDLADATARLTLAWGAAGEQVGARADDLVAGRAALVRVDPPAGASVATVPDAITVAEVARPSRTHAARVVGRAPAIDPLIQGEGFFAIVADGPPLPGTALSALVPRAAAATGVAVPASAVVWVDAQPAVYVEASGGVFARRTIALGPRIDDRWIATAGVAAGERVVVAGAARLLSSEVLHAAPAED